MPGMFTSSKARSIPERSSVKLRLTARSASSAFCAHTVSYPSMRKNSSSICTIESSSSTISSRCSGPIPINPTSNSLHPDAGNPVLPACPRGSPPFSPPSCQVAGFCPHAVALGRCPHTSDQGARRVAGVSAIIMPSKCRQSIYHSDVFQAEARPRAAMRAT